MTTTTEQLPPLEDRLRDELERARESAQQARERARTGEGEAEAVIEAEHRVQAAEAALAAATSEADARRDAEAGKQARRERRATLLEAVELANAAAAELDTYAAEREAAARALVEAARKLVALRARIEERRERFLQLARKLSGVYLRQDSARLSPGQREAVAELVARLEDAGADLRGVRVEWSGRAYGLLDRQLQLEDVPGAGLIGEAMTMVERLERRGQL